MGGIGLLGVGVASVDPSLPPPPTFLYTQMTDLAREATGSPEGA